MNVHDLVARMETTSAKAAVIILDGSRDALDLDASKGMGNP